MSSRLSDIRHTWKMSKYITAFKSFQNFLESFSLAQEVSDNFKTLKIILKK